MDIADSRFRTMFQKLKKENPAKLAEALSKLDDQEMQAVLYEWPLWARDEQLPPKGQWRYWVALGGRSSGKDISDKTPMLTSNRGWVTMGELEIGDYVFDESGNPTKVVNKYIPPVRELFKFTFSDGNEIISSEEHEWVTFTRRDKEQFKRRNPDAVYPPTNWPSYSAGAFGPKIRTTREIIDTFTTGVGKENNHYIPVCKPLVYPEKDYIINPYYLGYWLGDGDITGNFKSGGGIHSELKVIDAYKCKRIPGEYLEGSIEQRFELLKGLLDSGEYVDNNNRVEFCSTKKTLAENVLELVISLGQKATLSKGDVTTDGRFTSKKYRVCWTQTVDCFKLKRKSSKFKTKFNSSVFDRAVINYEKVEWEPTSCIEVESPHHLFLAGRGLIATHNTRLGSEWVIERARQRKGPIALIGQTTADVRDVMIEIGPSAIMQVCPPDFMPNYEPSKRRLTFPNGVICTTFSGDEPGQLRGPQHQTAWCDELPKFSNPEETYQQMNYGLRIGESRGLISTTPTSHAIIKELYARSQEKPEGAIRVVGMPTHDNAANIDPEFLKDVDKKKNTRLYRQEILGEILFSDEDALFTPETLDDNRVAEAPELVSIVVSIDPAVTNRKVSDSTAIVVCGVDANNHGYVLFTLSMKASPSTWARKAIEVFDTFNADYIVIEVNNGGDLLRSTLEQCRSNLPIKEVRASSSKIARMEPISLLAEQGKVHMVGLHKELEDQLVAYIGKGASPDLYDAACWGLSAILLGKKTSPTKIFDLYL